MRNYPCNVISSRCVFLVKYCPCFPGMVSLIGSVYYTILDSVTLALCFPSAGIFRQVWKILVEYWQPQYKLVSHFLVGLIRG